MKEFRSQHGDDLPNVTQLLRKNEILALFLQLPLKPSGPSAPQTWVWAPH